MGYIGKFVTTAACAAMFSVAAPAFAATYDLSDSTTPATAINLSAGDISSGGAFHLKGSFVDSYFFNLLSGTSASTGAVNAVAAKFSLIGDPTISLYNTVTGALVGATAGTYDVTTGSYRVDVAGTVLGGTKGGLYGFDVNIGALPAAPVPGPGGFLVALAGGAVIVASRRKKAALAAA